MEPESSSPPSQVVATSPYPEPARSSPCPTSHFLKIHLNITLPSMPDSSNWALFFRFPHQNPIKFSSISIRTRHLILLDFIARKLLGEEYRVESLATNHIKPFQGPQWKREFRLWKFRDGYESLLPCNTCYSDKIKIGI